MFIVTYSNYPEAHANAQTLVSNEQRAAPGCDKNCQVADMSTSNAIGKKFKFSVSLLTFIQLLQRLEQ